MRSTRAQRRESILGWKSFFRIGERGLARESTERATRVVVVGCWNVLERRRNDCERSGRPEVRRFSGRASGARDSGDDRPSRFTPKGRETRGSRLKHDHHGRAKARALMSVRTEGEEEIMTRTGLRRSRGRQGVRYERSTTERERSERGPEGRALT